MNYWHFQNSCNCLQSHAPHHILDVEGMLTFAYLQNKQWQELIVKEYAMLCYAVFSFFKCFVRTDANQSTVPAEYLMHPFYR